MGCTRAISDALALKLLRYLIKKTLQKLITFAIIKCKGGGRMKKLHTDEAPAALGPYSQSVIAGGLVFTSGQIPLNPKTGLVDGDDIVTQAHRVCKNIAAVLEASGSSLKLVIKTTCYLYSMSDFSAFNAVYAEYFTGNPARSCVQAAKLPKNVLIELDVIAELE